MTKVTIARLFEISKYLATPAGQQLKDALEFLSSFSENMILCLRNGLTFADNFQAEIKSLTVVNNVESVVMVNSKVPVSQIMVRRVIDDTYYVCDSLGWKYNPSGQLVVKLGFAGSPPANRNISVELVVFFG